MQDLPFQTPPHWVNVSADEVVASVQKSASQVLDVEGAMLCSAVAPADTVVMLTRNLEYCSYAHTALFMTDDFDELEQKYNQVCGHRICAQVLACITSLQSSRQDHDVCD